MPDFVQGEFKHPDMSIFSDMSAYDDVDGARSAASECQRVVAWSEPHW
jgi:hypothetical protein